MRRVALTLHTEQLFDDTTWQWVTWFIQYLERIHAPATFFTMTPIHARCRPEKAPLWLERMRAIRSAGQLIELHTHFYRTDAQKVGTTEHETILQLVERDARFMRQNGFDVRGFVAGTWILNTSVAQALCQNGFTYDCTAHAFNAAYLQNRGHHV